MSTNIILLVAVVLTAVVEVAAVVILTLAGKGTDAVLTLVTGMIGPVIVSLLALVRAEDANKQAGQAQQVAEQVQALPAVQVAQAAQDQTAAAASSGAPKA